MRRLRRVLIVVVVLAVAWALFFGRGGPSVAPGSVLVLDIQGEYIEAAEPPLLSRLVGAPHVPLLRLYSDLRKAERDPRLYAVVLRIRGLEIGWGKAQEIRDAITRLRAAGRRTVAYLELEPVGVSLEYYVASAAERVVVAPGTHLPFVGLAAEYLFLGGMFDKLGVDLEVERVGPHKTAADFFAARSMSDANREMATWLLDSIESQFVSGVAQARGIPEAQVRAAIAAGASSPEELSAAGLVDGGEFFSDVLAELGAERPVLEPEDWARVAPAGFAPKARIALVYGSGNVISGEGDRRPGSGPVLASATVSEAIDDAAEADDVDAILFRIDSPGGSALASDVVWHATQRARAKKPVVVSFSDVAASGGYYVACGADAIIAQPGTITGSIGVLAIRPVIRRLYEKLGIGFEALLRGEHADVFALSQPLDPASRAWLGGEIEETYQLFLDRVTAGRKLDRAAVEAVARGRVWTGEQAARHGLVDGLGGLHTAVATLREKLDLAPDADLELVVYPPPRPLAEDLAQLLQGATAAAPLPLPLPRALRQALAWVATVPPGAPALLPPLALEVR
jgi:protease-4